MRSSKPGSHPSIKTPRVIFISSRVPAAEVSYASSFILSIVNMHEYYTLLLFFVIMSKLYQKMNIR